MNDELTEALTKLQSAISHINVAQAILWKNRREEISDQLRVLAGQIEKITDRLTSNEEAHIL